MNDSQQELMARRQAGFDQFVAEMMPVLVDFATTLNLPDPPLIIADPTHYLPMVDAWLRDQVIAAEDRTCLMARIGYLVGEVLVQQFSACWLVCDSPESRLFARYV